MSQHNAFTPYVSTLVRYLVRQWRTQAGAAELRREQDRIRGASKALDLTLRAWDVGIASNAAGETGGATTPDPTMLQRKRTEVLFCFVYEYTCVDEPIISYVSVLVHFFTFAVND